MYKQAMESGHPFDGVLLDLTIPGGLGGRDMSPKQFENVFKRAQEIVDKNLDIQYETIGVRE